MNEVLQIIWKIVMAVLGAVGFSILFFIRPRRLPWAAFGGVITCGVYLFVQLWLGGEFIPNLAGSFAGAIFSEVIARVTKAPVPIYLVPCMITLVPGGLLYRTMSSFIQGEYGQAGSFGLAALAVAAGIAGGIMVASIMSMVYVRLKGFLTKKE